MRTGTRETHMVITADATSPEAIIQAAEGVEVEVAVAAVVMPEAAVVVVVEEEATTIGLSTMLSQRTSRAATGHRWITMTPTRRSAKPTTLPYQRPAVLVKAEAHNRLEVQHHHKDGPWAFKQPTTTRIFSITIRNSLYPLSTAAIILS
jgi:hypothetical protein